MSTNPAAPREKHRNVFQALLLACLLALSAAACGQKGPLYLPAQEPPANAAPSDTSPDEEDDSDDETGRD